MITIPAVMLLVFHLLLYGLQPDIPADLQETGRWLWHYLLHDPTPSLPNTDLLDMPARRHMLDVKRILLDMRHAWWVITAVFLLLLAMAARKRMLLAQALRWSAYAGLGTLAAGALLAVLNFRWAFVMLHYLLFTEQNWVFAADSALIRLFPLTYFQQFFLYWLFLSVMGFLLLLLAARFLRIHHANPDTRFT